MKRIACFLGAAGVGVGLTLAPHIGAAPEADAPTPSSGRSADSDSSVSTSAEPYAESPTNAPPAPVALTATTGSSPIEKLLASQPEWGCEYQAHAITEKIVRRDAESKGFDPQTVILIIQLALLIYQTLKRLNVMSPSTEIVTALFEGE